ncbi:hypothetical protein H310_05934 [Aphanomyces invadans]|uniref:SAC3/GANP/THP3 conserved domain-containing protein n=1 Tax=Aphanomyces invadans TaxID=157072 RepID=A0A024U8B2_9STRA|nr:hypothetical protein H310_05934 [Aphanomyces invadans]ETW02420.1 hypothetical protein H310_05934 [Aphanomyces invadans]|eukprot:XP_008869025.1 hypothetical protein H310_05934 [Aphanomyces invadans]
MRGCCVRMCPALEAQERSENHELSKYERPPYGCPVKRYRRSAAGTMIDPADVRPVPVLLETTHHLLSLLPSELELPLDLYHFLDDRFRAIRTDLVLQEDAPPAILQPIARFYLLAQCILRHSTSKNLDGRSVSFASLKHLLEEQMHSILAQLKVSSLEFEQYYLLVLMDSASFSLTLRDVYIRSANAQALWSWFRSNTRRGNSEHILHRAILFGRLADQYHQHLIVLSKAFTKQDKFPLSDLVRIVGLTCIDDVALLCHAFHIDVHEIESSEPFVRFNERPLQHNPDPAILAELMHLEFTRIDALRRGAPFREILLRGM